MSIATRCIGMLIPLLLAGCASTFDNAVDSVGEPFVQPGKYDLLRCQDLVPQAAAQEKRVKDIHELMERSGDGVGGTAVNIFVYGPDLKEAEAMLRSIRRAQAEKNCDKDAAKSGQPTAALPPSPAPSARSRRSGVPSSTPVSRQAPVSYPTPAAGNLDPLH